MFKTLFTLTFALSLLISCGDKPPKKQKKTVFDYSFLWNFSEVKKISYSYEMTSIDEEVYERNTDSHTLKNEITGDLVVTSNGLRTASISIENATKTLYSLTEEGEWSPANPRLLGKSIIGDLTQYSQFNNYRLDALWDAYLPLPLEEIKEGETYELKMRIPVGIESNKYVKGHNELTFMGYETIMNRKCIVLKGDIKVSEVDELEFEGEYTHFMKGKGTYYFDANEHIYVKAEVEITLVKKLDSGENEDIKKDLFKNQTITETFRLLLK